MGMGVGMGMGMGMDGGKKEKARERFPFNKINNFLLFAGTRIDCGC